LTLLGAELEHRETGEAYRVVGADPEHDAWIVSPIAFGPTGEFTITELVATFIVPAGEVVEQPSGPPSKNRGHTLAEFEARSQSDRAGLQRLRSRTVEAEPTPEDHFNGLVPAGYRSQAQQAADEIIGNPAKLRAWRIGQLHLGAAVDAAVANAIAEQAAEQGAAAYDKQSKTKRR
jgi:hypothetical protein